MPLKTCNWNCVYCQLGRTRPVVTERRDHIPVADLVADLAEALAACAADEVDWVTVVGSGEPLLHAHLGDLLRTAKALTSHPVAVITNGSLLRCAEVREELAVADAVLPTLDVGSPALFRRLNRPHPEVVFERHVEGLEAFREAFRGKLWVELMLVRGINDADSALLELAARLRRIRPDEIHVNVPSRPPVERWVRAPEPEQLLRAAEILGSVGRVRMATEASGQLDLRRCEDVIDAVAAVVARHPMSEQALVRALAHRAPGKVREALSGLEHSGRVRRVVRNGVVFWISMGARFPDAGRQGPAS